MERRVVAAVGAGLFTAAAAGAAVFANFGLLRLADEDTRAGSLKPTAAPGDAAPSGPSSVQGALAPVVSPARRAEVTPGSATRSLDAARAVPLPAPAGVRVSAPVVAVRVSPATVPTRPAAGGPAATVPGARPIPTTTTPPRAPVTGDVGDTRDD